jgi:hypothetical protein
MWTYGELGKEFWAASTTKKPKALSKDQTTIITKGACQVKVTVEAKGYTYSNIHTAWFMAVK